MSVFSEYGSSLFFADEDNKPVYNDNELDRVVESIMAKLAGGGVMLNARVYRNTNQTFASSAIVSFTSVRYDTGQFWDSGFPTRLTAKQAGLYYLHGSVAWASHGGTFRLMGLMINGSTFLAANRNPNISASEGVVSTLYRASANDYFELYVEHNNPGSTSIITSGNYTPEMSVVRLAD